MVGKESVRCAKCGITSKENSSLTFHRFPLPSIHGSLKARVWAKFCFPNDVWTSDESLVKLYKQHMMLCGNHFDVSSFTSSAKTRLNKFAIPAEAQNILVQLRDEPKEAQNSQKESTRTCCMCGSSPSQDPSITLHRFPKPGTKNALRCELWAKYCFPNEAWSSPKFHNELNSKHKMLCSKHFKSTCFIEKKLFRTAVPGVQCHKDTIINLPDQPAIFEPVAGLTRDNDDHNYSKKEDFEEMAEDPAVAQDSTTVNILESGELPLTSECEEHVMQIDSLEVQGIGAEQNHLSDSFGGDHLQPKPSLGSDHLQPKLSLGSDHLQPKHSLGSDHIQPKPSLGSDHLQPKPSLGSDHLQPKTSLGPDQLQPKPYFGSVRLLPKPSFMAERYRFRQRKQNDDESIIKYISQLVNMSKFCDFKTSLEDNLRDQLVCGLRSEQIRQRLFSEESLDYIKAVVIACAMEAAETGAGVVEQTVESDGESGDGEVATSVVHGDSAGDTQRGFANKCSVCGSADHWGEGCRQSRFVCGMYKLKGHLNRDCPMRPGGRQQGRYDTDNMGGRQLQGRCDTDNVEGRQLQGRCVTDNMGGRQLQGRCDTDDKGAHVPAASGVTGQVDLLNQLGEDKPPSLDREDWETEDNLQQLSRKGYKRLVIWVDESQLPMDIDMESFVSSIRKT